MERVNTLRMDVIALKKRVMLLLTAALVLLISGCKSSGNSSGELKANSIWMVYQETADRVKNADGQSIFEYTYYTPELRTVGSGTDRINNQLDNLNTAFVYGDTGIEALTNKAKNEHKSSWFSCFQRSRYIDTARVDDTVVSLKYTDTIYTGGLQARTTVYGKTFDIALGNTLTLGSLTENEEDLRAFCTNYILDLCKSAEYHDTLYKDYEMRIGQILDNWCFTDEGIAFIAQPYTLSAQAEQNYIFTIPYEDLQGKIGMKWMPMQVSGNAGEMQVQAENSTPSADFVYQPGEQVVRFMPKGNVHDFSLTRVKAVWKDREPVYESVNQLMYSPVVYDGQSFTIQIRLPESVPNLMVSYQQADGSQVQYFLMNQGGPVLMNVG